MTQPRAGTFHERIQQRERELIAAALGFHQGNRREAAQSLGIARSTLLAKIRKYGLYRTTERPAAHV